MKIEITTRDGAQGYVQVIAHNTIGYRTWWISDRQEHRVLDELHAPLGDGLLSGRYVAMYMDGGEQIPVQMEPRREGGIIFRGPASLAGSALRAIPSKTRAEQSKINGRKSAEEGKKGGRPRKSK